MTLLEQYVLEQVRSRGFGLSDVGQDNRITKGDLPTRIEVSVIRNRLQFIGINEDGTRGHTQASGSVSAATVSDFVESFWYWKKQH